jgi:predicted nuclease of restriction endonuclease-like RecB superfamily
VLTGELVRARVVDGCVRPQLVHDGTEAIRDVAGVLIDVFREGADARWTRARIDAEVQTAIGDSKDHKLLRGLAKVIADASEFSVEAPVEPVELRDRVFRAARARGPLALEPGPLGRPVAADVLGAVGAELGLSAEQILDALYADRREEQRITACDVDDVDWLLRRYDVALVQAVLLHATELKIVLQEPTVPRMRQLFRWIKFHQLVHAATRVGDALHVTLDGPLSLFSQSTRYGAQLAAFLPALLLQDRWTLDATVVWDKRGWKRQLKLASTDGLVSHRADTGAWVSKEQAWFKERFLAANSDWKLHDGDEPLDLDGRAVLLPDFKFTQGKRTAYLEIVGVWRKDWLERRLALIQAHGPGNLVLAVSKKLKADKEALALVPGAVVEFAEIVPPKLVIEALDRVGSAPKKKR